jgi:quercetin dioxygenase-like cupin family protein
MRKRESVALATLCVACTLAGQVPMHQEPHHHPAFENEALRVLEPTIPPGEATLEHLHTHDDVTICISGAAVRSQRPGGEWSRPAAPCVPGTVSISEYAGKPSSHTVENTGSGVFRLLAIENLRMSGWANPEVVRGPGVEMTKEGRAFRVYSVTVPGGGEVRHVHQAPVVAVLVSGSATVGKTRLDQVGKWVVIPAGESPGISAAGDGARVIEVEVR